MDLATLTLILMLTAPQAASTPDPNAPPAKEAPRRAVGFKVFNNMDRPITGLWDLEIPDLPARRIEIRELQPGLPGALVGGEPGGGEPLLRIEAKKEGIGYEGELKNVLGSCGLDSVPVTEFLPLGDSIVLRFEASPTNVACPPMDSGRAGRFFAVSPRGGPVRLRDFSEISSSRVKETYSIGGDRPNIETTYEIPLGAVSVEPGSELKFLQRVKAPLDSSYWFEVEALISPGAGVQPPRGYVSADSLRFVGSLSLKRVKQETPAGR